MEQDKEQRDTEEEEDDEDEDNGEEFLPGFATFQDYSKNLLSLVMRTTKLSHAIPSAEEDYDYYSSYPSFNEFTAKMGQRISKSIAKILQYHHMTGPWPSGGLNLGVGGSHDHSDLSDAIIEANDTLLEQVNNLLDEAAGVRKANQSVPGVDSKQVEQSLRRGHTQQYSYIHAPNIIRPQLKWADKIDNSLTPFQPIIRHKPNALRPLPTVSFQSDSSISSFISAVRDQMSSAKRHGHPYRYELEQFKPTEQQLELKEPQSPSSLNDVALTTITTVEQLQELNRSLLSVSEFAVDLEHHSYRSFLGIVCLMQLSTRNHDYIIDVLELREHMHILNDSFTHPGIVKIFHGADWDVLWLQRDFGVYIVNMFDTHQASRALQLPKNSLAFLLKYCCDIDADKQYQLADWRIRPLPDEMIKYAREDTHYLLYIYDRMRNELIRRSDADTKNLLKIVIERSTEICLKEYKKPIFSEETTYLNLYHKHRHRKPFNSRQDYMDAKFYQYFKHQVLLLKIHCLKLLCKWRDSVARQEDESYGYTLPNHMMFQIAEILPREPQGVLACCNPTPALVKQYLNDIHHLVMEARRQPFIKCPHIPNPAIPLLTSTPEPKSATAVQEAPAAPPAHVIPTDRLVPKGPPVSMATTLNDALCQNIQLQCVYFEEWKKRLAGIEEKFLQPLKEAPLINETIIVNTPGKSLEISGLDVSGEHMTNEQGDSPVDGILEDTSTVNDDQDDEHDVIRMRQQNRKRKKKNQSLREMELSRQRKENPPTESAPSFGASSMASAPPSKKRRLGNFTPHDYNQTRFADITASHDPPATPYTPYSTEHVNKKQHKKYTPRSYTHQKSGQKSLTYKSNPHQFKKPQR